MRIRYTRCCFCGERVEGRLAYCDETCRRAARASRKVYRVRSDSYGLSLIAAVKDYRSDLERQRAVLVRFLLDRGLYFGPLEFAE